MINRIVIGTLAMVNTVLSPLAPSNTKSPDSYDLQLSSKDQIVDTCVADNRAMARTALKLNIEHVTQNYFSVRLAGGVCTSKNEFHAIALELHLPIQLLDEERLANLPLGFGYVVPGMPAPEARYGHVRVKITRLANEGDVTPVRIEWLPDSETGKVEHAPLTIWMSHSTSLDVPVWRKVQFDELKPLIEQPVNIHSELTTASARNDGASAPESAR